jgi:hypothetical protein
MLLKMLSKCSYFHVASGFLQDDCHLDRLQKIAIPSADNSLYASWQYISQAHAQTVSFETFELCYEIT